MFPMLLEVMHRIGNSFPVLLQVTSSSSVVLLETFDSLLHFTIGAFLRWWRIPTNSRTKYYTTVFFFIFKSSDEDPYIWMTNADFLVPPIVKS